MEDISNNERSGYLLTKRAAGHLVLEEVGAVRQAVAQIRAIVADAVTPLARAVEAQGIDPETQGDAVRSLQFADMVEQLGAYCDAELDNLECLARDLNAVVNDVIVGTPGGLKKLLAFQHTLEGRLDVLRLRLADRGHKSVVQDSMSEGDIELF